MKRAFFPFIMGLALVCSAFSQTKDDPNDGLVFVQDQTGFSIRWWSRVGSTYFFQCSVDLVTWVWCQNMIVTGGVDDMMGGIKDGVSDTVPHFDVSGTTDTFFVRLWSTAQTDPFPYDADFDGDRVINGHELDSNTNPLSFADTDGDGISDDWEKRYGLDPNSPGDATLDKDLDGVNNYDEYMDQSDPEGTDPTDFYNNNFPTITVSGDNQTAEPGTFSPLPIVIEMKHGLTPVYNGPITVYVQNGSAGQISVANDGTGLATSLNLNTDANGRVTVYYKHPAPASPEGDLPDSFLNARIGSALPDGQGHSAYLPKYLQQYTQVNYTYPTGTVGLNATEAIDNRIVATNLGTNYLGVFSTAVHDPPNPNYIRNTSSWCYDLRQAMTCISPYNSEAAYQDGGAAITPQHFVNAWHVRIPVGQTVRFVTANNVILNVTIAGRADDPTHDVSVYTFDTPLPATITPCKVLPANYADYLSYLGGGRLPPVMTVNKLEQALVSELHGLDVLADYVKPRLHTNRLPFYANGLESGDSGSPSFLVINDTINDALVLLSTLTYGNALGGAGTFLTNLASPTLNEMIALADADATARDPSNPINTGLQVQAIDLSVFDTFTPP